MKNFRWNPRLALLAPTIALVATAGSAQKTPSSADA